MDQQGMLNAEFQSDAGRIATNMNIDDERQISNCPSSQDVRIILTLSVPRDDDEAFTSAAGVDAMNSECPTSHALEAVDKSNVANVLLPSILTLLDSVDNLSMQVERLVTLTEGNQRQSTTIDELKTSVVTHDQMLAMFDKQAVTLTTHVQNIVEKQLQQSSSKTNEMNLHTMRQMVKDEMSPALVDSQQTLNDAMICVLGSQAATQIPSSMHIYRMLSEMNLKDLIERNNFSAAFQQALSATDLSMVTYVCSKVPPTKIFSMTPCPLQQPVILSLIQQLSTNLSSQPELKIKYLQDAIPSIDPKAPGLTDQGIQRVIGRLHQNLNTFLQNPSSAPYSRQIKCLTMAAQSLLN